MTWLFGPSKGNDMTEPKTNAPSSDTVDPLVRCAWVEDSEGCYGTSCGHAWMFTHELGLEGEQGDGFRFCPFCGNEISTPKGKGHGSDD